MKKQEFLDSVRHIAAFYDIHVSPLSYTNYAILMPIIHSLAVMMWVGDYTEDEHSVRIKTIMKNFYDKGSLDFDNDTKN